MNFDHYCIYLAGFDRLGRHLYGSWWDGSEYLADSLDPPEIIEETMLDNDRKIEAVVENIKEVRAQRRQLQTAAMTQELNKKDQALHEELGNLNEERYRRPYNPDTYQSEYERYVRKVTAEEMLTNALETDVIKAWFGLSPTGRYWSDWGNKDGFVLFKELSFIKTPYLGSSRRMPFFFNIPELDEWLETIEPINPEAKPKPTDYETYQILIREFHQTLNGRVSKSRFEEYVRSKVDRFRPRIFNHAWADEKSIPVKWKDPGNIPKTERHKE